MANKTQAPNNAPTKNIRVTDSGDRINFHARLERASQDVDDNRTALRDAVALRDQLLVDAHDNHGMTTTAIARAAHLSQSRVVEILANH